LKLQRDREPTISENPSRFDSSGIADVSEYDSLRIVRCVLVPALENVAHSTSMA